MGVIYVLIGYFVIAIIVFAVLDYFYAKKNNDAVHELIIISILWILLLVGSIFVMPFYVIDKFIKRKNKL